MCGKTVPSNCLAGPEFQPPHATAAVVLSWTRYSGRTVMRETPKFPFQLHRIWESVTNGEQLVRVGGFWALKDWEQRHDEFTTIDITDVEAAGWLLRNRYPLP